MKRYLKKVNIQFQVGVLQAEFDWDPPFCCPFSIK